MRIQGFIWDYENIEHISKHDVTPSEVDETLLHPCVATKERYGRFALFGVSNSGGYLVTIIEPRDNDMYYVKTTYQMKKV